MKEPDYKIDDTVTFKFGDDTKTGQVYIVDRRGTLGQNVEPSYDIMIESENMLYKHIRESLVVKDNE